MEVVLAGQAKTSRMFNYYVILHSSIRKVYYLSSYEVKLPLLKAEIKDISDELHVIINGNSYFVIRRDLDEDDKNFLKTFAEVSPSNEEVIKLGTLLGYTCPHPDTLGSQELNENDKYGVSFYVKYRYDEYDKPTTSLLFGFMCQQTIEEIEENCEPLLQDLKNSINDLLSVDVFMTIDPVKTRGKVRGKKSKYSSKKHLNRKKKKTKRHPK